MKLFLILITGFIFIGCSQKATSTPFTPLKARHFETKVHKMKAGYLEHCLMPLNLGKYSERGCSTKLLNALERSWGLNFNKKQLLIKSNEIFFKEVDKQLKKEISTNSNSGKELKQNFNGPMEAMRFFRQHYSFSAQDLIEEVD